MKRWIFVIGALFGALGVAGGALGAHVLRHRLSNAEYENFQHAVSYLLVHGPLLLALASFTRSAGAPRGLVWCAAGIIIGMALFAGGLVGSAVGHLVWVRPVIPWGGSILILSWLGLAVIGIRDIRS